MSTISKHDIANFEPVQAVIVYKRHEAVYLENHMLFSHDGKFKWGEGMPLQKSHLSSLAKTLGDQTFSPMRIDGVIPERLLFFKQSFTSTLLIWWLPPSKHKLYFKPVLKMPNAVYNLPGLILVADRGSLDIYAVKGNKKPDLKTKLFKAPFHNTSNTGDVCLGSTGDRKVKDEVNAEMARMERQFFNSRFTHGGQGNVLKGHNINLVLKAAIKKPFNEKLLTGSQTQTLDTLIKRHSK